jgi:hypothetical protein
MNSPKQATLDSPIQRLIARRWRPYAFADRPVSDDDLRFDEDDSSGADPGRGSLMDQLDRTGRANQIPLHMVKGEFASPSHRPRHDDHEAPT